MAPRAQSVSDKSTAMWDRHFRRSLLFLLRGSAAAAHMSACMTANYRSLSSQHSITDADATPRSDRLNVRISGRPLCGPRPFAEPPFAEARDGSRRVAPAVVVAVAQAAAD